MVIPCFKKPCDDCMTTLEYANVQKQKLLKKHDKKTMTHGEIY